MLGRAIALVREDQLSLAIGKRGQNVRLASKLCGWDIDIMTQTELDQRIEKAMADFTSLEGISEELAERLIGEGFLTFDDLSVIEPSALMAMGNLTEDQVTQIIEQAEQRAEEAEKLAAQEKQRAKQPEQQPAAATVSPEQPTPDQSPGTPTT